MRFQRHDVSPVTRSRVKKTPTGGLRIPATPTKTGVFVYPNPDGSLRREYRPATEVFSPDSLASLDGAALTMDHPKDPVTPESWKNVSVGLFAKPAAQGRTVEGEALVLDAGAVSKVLSGELAELSCGYSCDFEPIPGMTPEGERYDGTQRNIRYNHVALIPVGRGRAGREARLHLDANAAPVTTRSICHAATANIYENAVRGQPTVMPTLARLDASPNATPRSICHAMMAAVHAAAACGEPLQTIPVPQRLDASPSYRRSCQAVMANAYAEAQREADAAKANAEKLHGSAWTPRRYP